MTSYNGEPRGEGVRVAIVCGRFNDLITERLRAGALEGLRGHGVGTGVKRIPRSRLGSM